MHSLIECYTTYEWKFYDSKFEVITFVVHIGS